MHIIFCYYIYREKINYIKNSFNMLWIYWIDNIIEILIKYMFYVFYNIIVINITSISLTSYNFVQNTLLVHTSLKNLHL